MALPAFAATYLPSQNLLVVEGEVDDSSVDKFSDQLRQLVDGGGGVVDLSGLTFCPSMAVSALVIHRGLAVKADVPFEFTAEKGSIAHRLLVLTGFVDA